jgi:Tfp pilus assembly protein PilE
VAYSSFLIRGLIISAFVALPALTARAQQGHLAQQRSCNTLAQSLLRQRNQTGPFSYELEAAHYDSATKTCYLIAKVSDPRVPSADPSAKTEVILDAQTGSKIAILNTNPKGKSVCWVKNQLGQGADQFNEITKELGFEPATKD